MPDLHTFLSGLDAIGDYRLLIAAAVIAAVSGLVRGFSGFGSALVYVPLISAIYGPRIAAPTLLLIDAICALPFALMAIPDCNWREVRLVMITGALGVPLGAVALLYVDVLALRWFIAGLVLTAVAVLVCGWRYHGKPTVLASLGVGVLSGVGAGAVQIGAPPLLVYWLGGPNKAATIRANVMVYFLMQSAMVFVSYLYGGLLTRQTLLLALLLGLPFGAALAIGASRFHGTSDLFYRRLAYIIIAISGLAGLPIFDALRRSF